MAVLLVLRLTGDIEPLLAAAVRVVEGIGMPEGLLARAVAPTGDGVIITNLWSDEDARRRANDDPAHHAAVAASGLEALVRKRTVERWETVSHDVAAG